MIFMYECSECGHDVESDWLNYEHEECESCGIGEYYFVGEREKEEDE